MPSKIQLNFSIEFPISTILPDEIFFFQQGNPVMSPYFEAKVAATFLSHLY